MKIGDLSERTGVPSRMLRYYEQQGLLTPQRGGNGYRQYTEDDVERVTTIRGLIRSGLPTRLIAIVLDMSDHAHTTWTKSCSRDFATSLAGELKVLDDKIACLSRSRETVRSFLEQTRYASLVESA